MDLSNNNILITNSCLLIFPLETFTVILRKSMILGIYIIKSQSSFSFHSLWGCVEWKKISFTEFLYTPQEILAAPRRF